MKNIRNAIKILVQIREWFADGKGIVSAEEARIRAAVSGLRCKWLEEDLDSAGRMLNRERGYNV